MRLTKYIRRGIDYIIHGQPVKYVTANIIYTNPSNKLQGKHIIVTGGGKGLGLAMAKRFVREGAKVLITGRNLQTLESAAKDIGCEYKHLDVQSIDLFKDFMKEADQILGGVNCLVNNAGVSLHEEDFTKVTRSSFDNQINTNLRGGFFLTQEFAEFLIERGKGGSVLFTSSEAGETVDERPYGWSKAAINSMVQGLAYKLAKQNFRINAIAPGITASEMTGLSAEGNIYFPLNMMERVYMPEEVAEVAAFLLSDAAGCLNGQILVCNNGRTLNPRWK